MRHKDHGTISVCIGTHRLTVTCPFRIHDVDVEVRTAEHHCGGSDTNGVSYTTAGNVLTISADIGSPHAEVLWTAWDARKQRTLEPDADQQPAADRHPDDDDLSQRAHDERHKLAEWIASHGIKLISVNK